MIIKPKPYQRWQIDTLQKKLSQRRVLILNGSRQCGKTTLVKQIADSQTIYRTLDDPTLLNAALSDPQGFIRHDDQLMIIDEIQRAPILLQVIKQEVDDNPMPGRFLLTGSANIQSLPSVTESLAGRVSQVRLRPLVLGEINAVEPNFLKNAFLQNFKLTKPFQASEGVVQQSSWNKDAYLLEAFHGGYPEARRLIDEREQRGWHKDYLNALIERDLKDITHIKRKDSMAKLIEVLAAWSSKLMDVSSICKSLALTRPTVESYINALESLYLIDRVRPWYKTDYDRVGKREKLFFSDTGMMTAVLRWRFDQVRLEGDLNGKLLETFVFNQLMAHVDVHESMYQLTHYRDGEKREVDFIVEREDGAVLGVEVKAASVIDQSAFKHLTWFRENIIPKQEFVGVVLYTGEHLASFGPKLWAVPINSLWA